MAIAHADGVEPVIPGPCFAESRGDVPARFAAVLDLVPEVVPEVAELGDRGGLRVGAMDVDLEVARFLFSRRLSAHYPPLGFEADVLADGRALAAGEVHVDPVLRLTACCSWGGGACHTCTVMHQTAALWQSRASAAARFDAESSKSMLRWSCAEWRADMGTRLEELARAQWHMHGNSIAV